MPGDATHRFQEWDRKILRHIHTDSPRLPEEPPEWPSYCGWWPSCCCWVPREERLEQEPFLRRVLRSWRRSRSKTRRSPSCWCCCFRRLRQRPRWRGRGGRWRCRRRRGRRRRRSCRRRRDCRSSWRGTTKRDAQRGERRTREGRERRRWRCLGRRRWWRGGRQISWCLLSLLFDNRYFKTWRENVFHSLAPRQRFTITSYVCSDVSSTVFYHIIVQYLSLSIYIKETRHKKEVRDPRPSGIACPWCQMAYVLILRFFGDYHDTIIFRIWDWLQA